MFSTLQGLKHHIRTAFETSDSTYHHCFETSPIMQGIYEGNGTGPIIWAVESSPLFHMMHKYGGYGINIPNTLSGCRICIAGFTFVDDTKLIQTGENKTDVLQRMQRSISMWEGLIRATGDGLVVERNKSSWWLLDFAWKPDGSWEYTTIDPSNPALVIPNFDGQLKPIQCLEFNQPFKTLGLMVSPNGDQTTELQHLKQKINLWTSKISCSPLQGNDAGTAYKSTIFCMMVYPLTATTFSKSKCKDLQMLALRDVLPWYHISQQFPPRLIHASSSKVFGLGFPDTYASQLANHFKILLRHGPTPSLTGKFIHSTTIEAIPNLNWATQATSFCSCTPPCLALQLQAGLKMCGERLINHWHTCISVPIAWIPNNSTTPWSHLSL